MDVNCARYFFLRFITQTSELVAGCCRMSLLAGLLCWYISAFWRDLPSTFPTLRWFPWSVTQARVSRCYACIANTTKQDEDLNIIDRAGGLAQNDELVVQTIKQWIRECQSTHAKCTRWAECGRQVVEGSAVTEGPKRLLAIEGSSSLYVRLVDTKALVADVDYAALSHCWGGNIETKLQTDSTTRLYQGLPVSDLPKTFRDAVVVTARLGLRFLWIDALCIKQDCKEDWLAEAPKMAIVYSQATISLAATAAADSTAGLFCQQPDAATEENILETVWTGLPWITQEVLIRPPMAWYIQNGILNTRGWVYQERIISPRTLHFAQDKILWECAQSSSSEFIASLPVSSNGFNHDPRVFVYNEWWSLLIVVYSGLALTFATDKLAAIAGIARFYGRYHGLSNFDYAAGVWKHAAHRDLLWFIPELRPRPGVTRAPSWSWASVDSQVEMLHLGEAEFNKVFTLLHFASDSQSHDGFVSTGTVQLCLKCSVFPLRDAYCAGEGEEPCKRITMNSHSLEINSKTDAEYNVVKLYLDHPYDDDVIALEGTLFVPMATLSPYGDRETMLWLSGLLVRKVDGQFGVYRRIGMLYIQLAISTWNEETWSKCQLSDGGMFQKDCEDGQYEIVMI